MLAGHLARIGASLWNHSPCTKFNCHSELRLLFCFGFEWAGEKITGIGSTSRGMVAQRKAIEGYEQGRKKINPSALPDGIRDIIFNFWKEEKQ
jgi:hypothetical protein